MCTCSDISRLAQNTCSDSSVKPFKQSDPMDLCNQAALASSEIFLWVVAS